MSALRLLAIFDRYGFGDEIGSVGTPIQNMSG
jgi:hypothetical protein